MMKTKEKRVAARNRIAAGKQANWPLSPALSKGFVGFVTNTTDECGKLK